MTAIELREFVLSKNLEGLTGVHAMKKEELLKAVKEAMGIKDEAPAKKLKRPKVKKNSTSKKSKRRSPSSRTRKRSPFLQGEKKVSVLRRRINRLKKQPKRVAKA
jgi:hypothetical protein